MKMQAFKVEHKSEDTFQKLNFNWKSLQHLSFVEDLVPSELPPSSQKV